METGVGGSVRPVVKGRFVWGGVEVAGDAGDEGSVGSRRRTTDPEERARLRDGGVSSISISLSIAVDRISTPSSVTKRVWLLVVGGIHDNRGDDLDR